MNSDESLWKVEDVGKYLNVSKDTIYRWIETKQMPAVRIGKKWLFRKEEVDTWLDSIQKRRSPLHIEEQP
ncbi:MAG: helix-turn-helix domain-containing protein [Victivallales bacterium]|nr:helix-turn-helix domain-containing protein [Victivallales bacterium]MBQ6471834.1 helix-turn-helix domain-containing protein [Victivallales bacterium]